MVEAASSPSSSSAALSTAAPSSSTSTSDAPHARPFRRAGLVVVVVVVAIVAIVASVAAVVGSVGVAGLRRPPPFSWEPTPVRAFSPGKRTVEIVFAGDVSVARDVGRMIARAGGDPSWLLQEVRPVFNAADLVFANLECVLAEDESLPAADKRFTIRGQPHDARALVDGGIDVVSVANNHAMDFLYPGFFKTLQATSALGLLVTGVQEEDGQRLLVVPVGQMKLGFLAYNAHGDEWRHLDWRPRSAPYDLDEVLTDVAAARAQVDQLVVSLHWGPELAHEPWAWQREHAHRLIDAGVDLLIGHHPHVEQPVETYNGGLIAYSLGDLAFDKKTPWLKQRTAPRFLLAVRFDGKVRTGFRLIPIRHDDDYRPRPAPGQDTASLVWPARVATGEPVPDAVPDAVPGAVPDALPGALPWRAADHIESATVERAGVACSTFATRRPRLNAGWLRWLERRFVCPGDADLPGDAVGRSAELSATVLRTGIWASPGGDEVLVRFPAVPLGAVLRLTAGFPDGVVHTERAARATEGPDPQAATVAVEVRIAGVVVHTERVPLGAGWREVDVDTRASGGERTVEVVVRGPRFAQPGFLFDLEVR